MSKRTHTRLDQKQRTEFFEEGKALAAAGDPDADCWICHTAIDYTVDPGTTLDSHTLDHYYPVDDYPELQNEPDNFRHAHKSCNSSRQKGSGDAIRQGLGEPMPDWWGERG